MGGEQRPDGTISMPYWDTSDVVSEFFEIFHDLDLCIVFDWPNWQEGKKYIKTRTL